MYSHDNGIRPSGHLTEIYYNRMLIYIHTYVNVNVNIHIYIGSVQCMPQSLRMMSG